MFRQFSLGPTKTYKVRVAAWVSGGTLPCDGYLTVTTVPYSGAPLTVTYGVQCLGAGKVAVWKTGGDLRRYVVRGGRCGCPADCGDRGVECKHRAAVALLAKEGLIQLNQTEAA